MLDSSLDAFFSFLRFGLIMKFLHELLLDLECMWNEASNGIGFINFWTCFGKSGNPDEDHHDLHLQPLKLMHVQNLLRSGHGFATKLTFSYENLKALHGLGLVPKLCRFGSARWEFKFVLGSNPAESTFQNALSFFPFPSYFHTLAPFSFSIFYELPKII